MAELSHQHSAPVPVLAGMVTMGWVATLQQKQQQPWLVVSKTKRCGGGTQRLHLPGRDCTQAP